MINLTNQLLLELLRRYLFTWRCTNSVTLSIIWKIRSLL